MGYTGINLGNVKRNNRSSILKLLNDQGAMSRKDIALALGLTPATVTLICTDLLAAGILREIGEMEEEKRAGRRKVLIDINYRYRHVLTVTIESEQSCVAICDLAGKCLGKKRIKTDKSKEPEDFLKVIADECKDLLWELSFGKEAILGIGVSIPGRVDRAEGICRLAYRIWDREVPIVSVLKRYLDLPIILENNLASFVEGELIYGAGKKWENFFFLKWGPGVGGAIAIQNRIYDGRNSNIAEIGHVIVEKNGEKCHCGRYGCLETKVSSSCIARKVRAACSKQTMPALFKKVYGDVQRIQAGNTAEWLGTEDEGLWAELDSIAEELSRAMVNTLTVLTPDKVIIYGELFEYPILEKKFREYCEIYDPAYNEDYILKSELSDRIEYIGPLAVVMNEMFLNSGKQED